MERYNILAALNKYLKLISKKGKGRQVSLEKLVIDFLVISIFGVIYV